MPELPFVTRDTSVQQNFDALNKRTGTAESGVKALEGRFPVKAADLDTSAKELFPQLVTAGNRKINFGTAEVEWPGGSIESKTVEVEHGLGATPPSGGVQLTPVYALATRRMFPQLVSTSKTKIALNSVCTDAVPGAGVKQTIHWLAIG